MQSHRWTVHYTLMGSNVFNVLTTCNARFKRALNTHAHSCVHIVCATAHAWYWFSRESYFLSPSFTLPDHPRLPPPPPRSPLFMPDWCPPDPTTASPPAPSVSSISAHIGPKAIAYQCTARLCSTFAECTPPYPQTPPYLLPPTPRCNPTPLLPASVGSAPSISAPPGPGTPSGPGPCREVTTHVSAPNISTDWTTALKKNLDTRGYTPSLLMIIGILLHTALAFARFRTTAIQSSSASESTLSRYLK